MTRVNMHDTRCEALFASGLQRSDTPTAEAVAEAISRAVRQFGLRAREPRDPPSHDRVTADPWLDPAAPGRPASQVRAPASS